MFVRDRIVRGRLVQDETVGVRAARTAVRILHGEPASNISQQLSGIPVPVHDWRESRRWGISEEMLRLSERQYRRLHESTIHGFVSMELSGRVRELNTACAHVLGYKVS